MLDEDGSVLVDNEGFVQFDDGNGGHVSNKTISFVYQDGGRTITDKYYVTAKVTTDSNGKEKVNFTYSLIDEMDITIIKTWNGFTTNPGDSNTSYVTAKIMYYDYDAASYKIYKNDENEDYVVTLNKAGGWDEVVKVPKFDYKGHRFIYQVKEDTFSTGDSGVVREDISTKLEYDPDTQTYKLSNYIGGDDADSMEIMKYWWDDGEEEYRNSVKVSLENGTFRNKNDPDDMTHTFQYSENFWLTEGNYYQYEWEDMPIRGIEGFNDGVTHYRYDYKWSDIKESVSGNNINNYYYDSDLIAAGEGTAIIGTLQPGARWIYAVKSKAYDSEMSSANSAYTDLMEDSNYSTWLNTNFDYGKSGNNQTDRFKYVYQNNGHYYAVCYNEHWNNQETDPHPTQIDIHNYRIGVINFKIDMNMLVGDALKNQIITGVTLRITNDYTNDYFTVPIDLSANPNLEYYYLLNLPKYNLKGEKIKYTVEEVSIESAGQSYQVNNGTCNIGTGDSADVCSVTVGQQTTIKNTHGPSGNPSDSNNDDIIEIEISNIFITDREFDFTKQWKDDHDTSGRNGLYIRLMRKSSKTGSSEERVNAKYTDNKSGDSWTFHYENLARYDSEGYAYTYWVQEVKDIPGYRSDYNNAGASDTVTVNTSATDRAYNNGTIINTRVGTMTHSGEKIWTNILSSFDSNYYPVAYVYLYEKRKGVTYTTTNGPITYKDSHNEEITVEDNGRTTDAVNGKLIAVTAIYNGEPTYEFKDAEGNLKEFPMYDENGAEIKYSKDLQSMRRMVSVTHIRL